MESLDAHCCMERFLIFTFLVFFILPILYFEFVRANNDNNNNQVIKIIMADKGGSTVGTNFWYLDFDCS